MKFICIFCIFLIGTIAADDWENFKTKNSELKGFYFTLLWNVKAFYFYYDKYFYLKKFI